MKQAKPTEEDYKEIDVLVELLDSLVDPDSDAYVSAIELARWWQAKSSVLTRVSQACQVAIENACDPNADTLEWKPEYKAEIEKIDKEKACRAAGSHRKVDYCAPGDEL